MEIKEIGKSMEGLVSRRMDITSLEMFGISEQLPSAQPERKFCEYCNADADGYVTPIEKNGHAYVRFGMSGWELSLRANGWRGSAKIRYCPMCGRDLFVKCGADMRGDKLDALN